MRRFWDQKAIIKKINAMRDRNLPLYANHVMKNHAEVFKAPLRQFGSWNKALHAAGITKNQSPNNLYNSRLGILRELRDALEKGQKDDIPQAQRLQATHYFGSLRNAFSAMKKDQRLLHGWSNKKIIRVLSRMHRSKESLAYARARRDVPGLVSAAESLQVWSPPRGDYRPRVKRLSTK
jgi:hypothetical protein